MGEGTGVTGVMSAEEVAAIHPGDTVMVGGFGLIGPPVTLIAALPEAPGARGPQSCRTTSQSTGVDSCGCYSTGNIRRAIGSHLTTSPDVMSAHLEGRLDRTISDARWTLSL